MPRPKKAPIESAPSTQYGRGVATAQALAAVPITPPGSADPLRAGVQATVNRGQALTANPQAPAGLPSEDPALTAAAGMTVPGLMSAPSAYPDRAVTHGLSSGPGAGPEALMGAGDIAAGAPIWRQLALATGDPYFMDLAKRAGLA